MWNKANDQKGRNLYKIVTMLHYVFFPKCLNCMYPLFINSNITSIKT